MRENAFSNVLFDTVTNPEVTTNAKFGFDSVSKMSVTIVTDQCVTV